MKASPHPPIPWPGIRPGRSLVLPLRQDWVAPPFGECCETDGLRLRRKAEFHVTLLDQAQLAAALAGPGEEALRALYEAYAWAPRHTGRYLLLHRPAGGPGADAEAWSVVERLQLPDLAGLRAGLARHLGTASAEPVPHVTLYVLGDARGIGVPDVQALQRRRVRDLAAPG